MDWRAEVQNGNPCGKNCPKRHFRCHGECQDYIKWSQQRTEYNKQQMAEKELDYLMQENTTKRFKEIKNGHKGKGLARK